MLWASADLRGYRKGKHSFYLLNFWRAFPPEDPTVTWHLRASERGQTILWRSLRPELVGTNSIPLSPDANLLVTHGTPDWQQQMEGVRDATQRLLDEVRRVGRRNSFIFGMQVPILHEVISPCVVPVWYMGQRARSVASYHRRR